jgi:hypothetical protein
MRLYEESLGNRQEQFTLHSLPTLTKTQSSFLIAFNTFVSIPSPTVTHIEVIAVGVFTESVVFPVAVFAGAPGGAWPANVDPKSLSASSAKL